MSKYTRKGDVCVIGAGIAGLMAADRLTSFGFTVDVYEAQDNFGGRIKDALHEDGNRIELGANWFSSQQKYITSQIERFKLDVIKTENSGNHLIFWNKKRSSFKGVIPTIGFIKNADILQGMTRFDLAVAKLKDKKLWDKSLSKYDKLSFGQWIDSTLYTRMGREFFQMVSEMVFGVESHMVSFLHVLNYANRSTSLTSLISVVNGHQEFRFKNGPSDLCRSLAESIGTKKIFLNNPVKSISINENGSVDVNSEKLIGTYKVALCAMPPPAVKQIMFEPPRSIPRERFLQTSPMGRVIKIQIIYEKPYWLEKGFSGQVMSNLYPISYTIDNSPPDHNCGVLAAFVCTSQAEKFMSPETNRKQTITRAINNLFGINFPEPKEILIEDWAENKWIGGSYGAYSPPGVLSRMGEVLDIHEHPIYWCGAEYGKEHPCQIEGALESSFRVSNLIKLKLEQAAL